MLPCLIEPQMQARNAPIQRAKSFAASMEMRRSSRQISRMFQRMTSSTRNSSILTKRINIHCGPESIVDLRIACLKPKKMASLLMFIGRAAPLFPRNPCRSGWRRARCYQGKRSFLPATRPEWVADFSLADALSSIIPIGTWWAIVPQERWPDHESARTYIKAHWQ